MKSIDLSVASRNVRTYILDYIVSYFYVPIAIWPLFAMKYVSFSELGIILMVGMIVNMLLNIPTGALADRFGRKTMILISYTLAFLSRVIIVFAFNFWLFLISEILKQASEAFYAGSAVALVYDSLKKKKGTGIQKRGITRIFLCDYWANRRKYFGRISVWSSSAGAVYSNAVY